jgi:hypothetical protein
VFSGTPWKNIDFFTPQSGDTALLDVFTAYEPPTQTTNSNPLVAGVANLNTQQTPVLQAILGGAYVDDVPGATGTNTAFTPFTGGPNGQANSILTSGSTLTARTANTSTSGLGPLQNVSELVGRWNHALSPGNNNLAAGYSGPVGDLTSVIGSSGSGFSNAKSMQYVDRFREAFIRPLAAVGNTRVWNLMIDVIAQTGRYPQGTSNPAYFVVDGEQRYWVHVAIDRYTGQVLDKQVEAVKE